MDVLDKYKVAWDNQNHSENRVSKAAIFKLMHKKSSSIVKWIFIIGIAEFIALHSIYFFVDTESTYEDYKRLGLANTIYYLQIVAYLVVFYFLYLFYKNYKSINSTSNTKTLMTNILNTRKVVKYYVFFNLLYLGFLMILVTIAQINLNLETLSNKQITYITLLSLIATFVLIGLFYGFYLLIYGILLNKLKRNYKKLAKL